MFDNTYLASRRGRVRGMLLKNVTKSSKDCEIKFVINGTTEKMIVGRKEMAVLLEDLLKGIGAAVSSVNAALEEETLRHYIERGYEKQDENYKPVMFNLSFHDGNEIRNIPMPALVHNTSMRLETVDVKLRLILYAQDGEVMAECRPSGSNDGMIDEMDLQFKNALPVEGIAKISDNHLKEL